MSATRMRREQILMTACWRQPQYPKPYCCIPGSQHPAMAWWPHPQSCCEQPHLRRQPVPKSLLQGCPPATSPGSAKGKTSRGFNSSCIFTALSSFNMTPPLLDKQRFQACCWRLTLSQKVTAARDTSIHLAHCRIAEDVSRFVPCPLKHKLSIHCGQSCATSSQKKPGFLCGIARHEYREAYLAKLATGAYISRHAQQLAHSRLAK